VALHHNPYLVLNLESSPCHMDGSTATRPVPGGEAGRMVFRPPSPVHMLTNDGDRMYRNRLIELKDLGEEAGEDATPGAPDAPLAGLRSCSTATRSGSTAVDLTPGERLRWPAGTSC